MEEGEGQDLRVREPLEGLVAPAAGVEVTVGVVDQAEQNGHGLFREGEAWSKVVSGHPELLWSGMGRMAPFYTAKPRNTHLVVEVHL